MFYQSKDPEFNFNSQKGLDFIYRTIDDSEPSVLILDPIGRMHHFAENESGGINRLGELLDIIIYRYSKTNLSIIYTHHFRKKPQIQGKDMGNYDPLDIYNFRGSAKWVDDADTIITMTKYTEHRNPHKWWYIGMRMTLRDDEGLDDLYLSVNRLNDLRVRVEVKGIIPPITRTVNIDDLSNKWKKRVKEKGEV